MTTKRLSPGFAQTKSIYFCAQPSAMILNTHRQPVIFSPALHYISFYLTHKKNCLISGIITLCFSPKGASIGFQGKRNIKLFPESLLSLLKRIDYITQNTQRFLRTIVPSFPILRRNRKCARSSFSLDIVCVSLVTRSISSHACTQRKKQTAQYDIFRQ